MFPMFDPNLVQNDILFEYGESRSYGGVKLWAMAQKFFTRLKALELTKQLIKRLWHAVKRAN